MLTTEQLEKQLKQEELNCIYLLYGEETFLLETILKKIKTNFGELKSGINHIKIDDTNILNMISDIETPSFGYEKKLIIAKNTGIFKKETKKKSSANQEMANKLSEYINENINIIKETVVIVFIEQEVDKNELYKTIDKYGIICNFEELKPNQIIARLKAICKAYKVNVDENVLKYLIESCGTNMQDLINEVRKQIEYAGENGEITNKSIDLLSIKKLDSVIFDLTDNLGKKNLRQALEVLNNLIYQKEPIQKILITLYNHFKKLYIVKMAERENINIAESLNLKPNQMFLTTKYRTQSGYFKEKDLRKILESLINLDYKYKIGLIDINVGLESILCTYCS